MSDVVWEDGRMEHWIEPVARTDEPVTEPGNIEFDEDLYLYKAQMYDSNMDQEYERYIVAIDFEDATTIAKAYFEDKCVSVTGIWQVDSVIGRYYD